jgi:hypothetical protein
MTSYPATPKQISYAKALYATHAELSFSGEKFTGMSEDDQQWMRQIHADATAKLDDMDKKEIGAKIDSIKISIARLREIRRQEQPTADKPAELKPGVYRVDGTVYQVKPNKDRTRLYAKRLVEINGERLNEADDVIQIEFEYAPGAIYNIKPEHMMPLAEGKALTIRYGRCLACGRKLSAAKSVEAGIGPVCIKYYAAAAVTSLDANGAYEDALADAQAADDLKLYS